MNRYVAAIGRFHGLAIAVFVGAARRQRRALAEKENGLASFAQPAHLRGQCLQCGQGHAGAQLLPVALRQLRLLERALDGEHFSAAAFKGADALEQLVFGAGVLQVVQRRERLHQRHQVVRAQLLDEFRQRLAQRQRDVGPLVDVVIVQEDRKQPHVLARGLEDGVLLRSNLQRLVEVRLPRAVDADELDRLHRLRHVVFEDLEVRRLEIGHRFVTVRGGGHVHAYEIGAGAENGLRSGCLLLGGLSEQESARGVLRVEGGRRNRSGEKQR